MRSWVLDFVGGWEPRVGDLHLAAVSVEGLPASTRPGEISVLGELPFPLRYSMRFIPLPPAEAAGVIRRMQRQWFWAEPSVGSLLAGKEPAKGFENRHAAAMVEEAAETSALNESGEAVFGFLTSTVVLAAPSRDEVASAARQVGKVLADRGFSGRLETLGAVGAFLGSLPGVASANVRRPLAYALLPSAPRTIVSRRRRLGTRPPGWCRLWTPTACRECPLSLCLSDSSYPG
jgi:type IV secretory pathway VirB4 component